MFDGLYTVAPIRRIEAAACRGTRVTASDSFARLREELHAAAF